MELGVELVLACFFLACVSSGRPFVGGGDGWYRLITFEKNNAATLVASGQVVTRLVEFDR